MTMMKHDLSEDALVTYKRSFMEVYSTIKRDGSEELLNWMMNDSDFFTAPASTRFHCNVRGGLMVHSYHVYAILKKKAYDFGLEKLGVTDESIAIIGLLHDLCKANFYEESTRNKKEDGKWIQVPFYKVNDQYPLGHGEKSLWLVSEYMKLTNEEAFAIRWHMGYTEPRENWTYVGQAFSDYPISLLTFEADTEATCITEKNIGID